MNRQCLDPERLAAARHAPADDPDRRHLESCAWCRALAASRDLFDDLGDLPAGADVDAADHRLAAFLQIEVAGSKTTLGSDTRAPLRHGPAPRRFAWPRRRVARVSSLAAAAVLLATFGFWLVRDVGGPAPGGIKLRDGAGGAQDLVLAAPRVVSGQGVLLSWTTALHEASFEVALTTADQTVVASFAVGHDRSHLLTDNELTGLRRLPRPLFVVVAARVNGDEVARSLPRLLPDPDDD